MAMDENEWDGTRAWNHDEDGCLYQGSMFCMYCGLTAEDLEPSLPEPDPYGADADYYYILAEQEAQLDQMEYQMGIEPRGWEDSY